MRHHPCLAASVIALAWLALFGSSCAPPSGDHGGQARVQPRPGSNVILILNDTMRRDRVGIYGGAARTPAFDAFARENVLFEHAYAQAPWTKPSIATLFTSLYPSEHAVLNHPTKGRMTLWETDVLSDDLQTLAEVLRGAGYRTAAFVGNPWMRSPLGFAQGFETYEDSFSSWEVPGPEIARAGLTWLKTPGAQEPFFLYLHFMDSHRPYPSLRQEDLQRARAAADKDTPPLSPWAQEEIGREVRFEGGVPLAATGIDPSIRLVELAYQRGIEDFDGALALFLGEFAAHPAFARTVIIVTSDHGEALFTRGYGNHGQGLYDDELAIPLAARFPGVSPDLSRIRAPVGLIDVMPTLCAYLGIAAPTVSRGRNILELTDADDPGGRYLLAQGVGSKPQNRAIRHGGYKLLWQPQQGADGKSRALFHVTSDPSESHDLLAPGNRSRNAKTLLHALLDGARDEAPMIAQSNRQPVPLDAATQERLRALGYLQ